MDDGYSVHPVSRDVQVRIVVEGRRSGGYHVKSHRAAESGQLAGSGGHRLFRNNQPGGTSDGVSDQTGNSTAGESSTPLRLTAT
jgi:hypothetical protein